MRRIFIQKRKSKELKERYDEIDGGRIYKRMEYNLK